VAIDGKTLRGSYNRDERQSTLHMVSAYVCANKVVIGQVKTVDIKGALVSIDAMGCQTDIANGIVAKQADYLLAVKGN
jgi:predicted transposase YbfD/YdcC